MPDNSLLLSAKYEIFGISKKKYSLKFITKENENHQQQFRANKLMKPRPRNKILVEQLN
jgi:hypothetical protein